MFFLFVWVFAMGSKCFLALMPRKKTSKTVTPLLDGSVTMENAATKRCFE
jgi:hypothetical protein